MHSRGRTLVRSAPAVLFALIVCAIPAGADLPASIAPRAEPRTLVVAVDGSGDYVSIQEAIDAARSGDTIHVKAGNYDEDVTVHSKERLRIQGEDVDRVAIRGRQRFGVFHIGKWPYGVNHVEVSGMTIHEQGGLAFGIFNGENVILRDLKVKGMLFSQRVQGVRIEGCVIGGSETTGIQFADSQAHLVGNFIHDNDHGVTVAGTSNVRIERNVITRNLFEGVVVKDRARAIIIQNTIVKNGGGIAFRGESRSEVSGNIVGFNKLGFLLESSSYAKTSFNALFNSEADDQRVGSPDGLVPTRESESDLHVNPRFVDVGQDDFRLSPDTPLLQVGGFSFLGALAPAASASTPIPQ